MRGFRWSWLGALVATCGLGASTASADLQPADPPVSLQVGSAVARSAEAALPTGPLLVRVSLSSRRDALRACLGRRSNCIEIADLDSFDSGDAFGMTPKMLRACAEQKGGKAIKPSGKKGRKSEVAEADLRELLRQCRLGTV